MASKSRKIEIPEEGEEASQEQETIEVPLITGEPLIERAEEQAEVTDTAPEPDTSEVPVEEPIPGPAPPHHVHAMDEIDAEIVKIVAVQRGKRSVPSLVGFRTFSNNMRYVIVDVNDSVIKDAWIQYKLTHEPNPEAFMAMMYKILDIEVPRMHRAVAPVNLE